MSRKKSTLSFQEWLRIASLEFLGVFDCATAFWRTLESFEITTGIVEADLRHPILDLGCGEGNFAKTVFGTGFVEVGLDTGKRDLREAKSFGTYSDVICGDARNIPLRSDTFRVVLSNSTLEHIVDIMGVLREIVRVLDVGGLLIATVPSKRFREYLFGSWILSLACMNRAAVWYGMRRNQLLNHFNCNSASEWKQMLMQVGLNPIYVKAYLPRISVRLWDFIAIAQFLARKLGLSQEQLKVPFRLLCLPILLRMSALLLTHEDEGGALLLIAKRDAADGAALASSASQLSEQPIPRAFSLTQQLASETAIVTDLSFWMLLGRRTGLPRSLRDLWRLVTADMGRGPGKKLRSGLSELKESHIQGVFSLSSENERGTLGRLVLT